MIAEKEFKAKRVINSHRRVIGYINYYVPSFVALFPVIAMYGLRYGIGVDYFNYEIIFNNLHGLPFTEYWDLFRQGVNYYYVEPGYYFLNQLFPNYRLLLWGIGVLVFGMVLWAIKDYSKNISCGLAIFAFLTIQYSQFLTVMRFTIALSIVLVAFSQLSEGHDRYYLVLVIVAVLFHKTALICLPLIFLRDYKSKKLNYLRDCILAFIIIVFPFILGNLFRIVSGIGFLHRYFSTEKYAISTTINISWGIFLHSIFALVPLIIFCRREIFDKYNTTVLFRICLLELPFRMMGLYNTWITRISRYPQVAQVIFVPLVLAKIKNNNNKVFLYAYYFVWFAFNFAYYEIINNWGTSLPYTSVFSQC